MLKAVLLLLALSLSFPTWADTPSPFFVRYDARYGSLTAESERSLRWDADKSRYVMHAESRLMLLGNALTTITEQSEFVWDQDRPVSRQYRFEQRGIGARTRSVDFDQENRTLTWAVDDASATVPFDTPVYDDLNGFLELRRQLQEGARDIAFLVAEKSEIKTHRYHVLDEALIDTPLGTFRTMHIERIRDAGNERSTELWLARDLDFVLLRLRQVEPDGRVIELNAKEIKRDPATPVQP